MKPSLFRTGLLTLLTLLVCLLLSVTTASAAESLSQFTCVTQPDETGSTSIHLQTTASGNYLFLPAAADLHKLTFQFSGETATLSAGKKSVSIESGVPFNMTTLLSAGSAEKGYPVTLRQGSSAVTFTIMKSENIPALFLTSSDADEDRAWVELSKDNKAKDGGIVLLRADGTAVYDGVMKSIKGRGHSTWDYPKKPYQIKLSEECDLLETGIPAEAEETWVLLANYCDETLLHNSTAYELANRLDLPFSPGFQQVDLYYDGEYRGTYLLCEKIEISDGRVDIADLEAEFVKANPDVTDFDSLPTATGSNSYGSLFQYVTGLLSPWDLSGGYLLEIDYQARAAAEKTWFTTSRGTYVSCKSPEYLSQTGVQYISDLFQQLEDAIYNGGVDPTSGKSYTDLVDVDSLARCYLLAELSQDPDSFLTSTFFYKPAGEEKFYAGPVWDFDSAFGSADIEFPVQGLVAGKTNLGKALLSIPSFQEAASSICSQELYDVVSALTKPTLSGSTSTLSSYAAEVAASQRMNAILWPEVSADRYSAAVDTFRSFLNQRSQWMYDTLTHWDSSLLNTIEFVDVPEDEWYHDAVIYSVEKGIFTGTSTFAFSPQNTMTRAMAVTVLYRLAGEPAVQSDTGYFDVPTGAWYSNAVAWAGANGITTGYKDGSFRPDRGVTRQEFATFLYRYAGSPQVTTSTLKDYADVWDVGNFAYTPMSWAVNTGLLKGNNYSLLIPKDLITRAQVATLLQRYLTM